MSKADLHIHTTYSFDGTASVRETLESGVRAGLDVIAITDHDEIRGSLEARAISPEYGIQVISGSEVSTNEGHLVVLFIKRNIPTGMSLIDTLICVREMGGIAIAAHPDHPTPNSISLQSITKAFEHPQAKEALYGIEVCNMNPTHSPFNKRSKKAAELLPLAQIASSDAHIASMIGAGITHFEGSTVRDLRRAIQRRTTQPEQINHEWPVGIFFRWLRLYLRRETKEIFNIQRTAQPLSSNLLE
jgi:predicted metal-dependent phosphoesterase TrpH